MSWKEDALGESPKKKTRTENVRSGKRSTEDLTRWKRQDFLSQTVYCEKYEELEKEKPVAWITYNDLTLLKMFEVLFGNSFKQIRKETELYAQRRGNSDFNLSLAEVECTVGILFLTITIGFQVLKLLRATTRLGAFDIVDSLPVDSDGNLNPMLFSVDNVFNSFQLIDQWSLRNIPTVGTLRADRLKEVPTSRKKEVLKKNRGYLEVALMSNQGKEKAVVAWKDNGAVIMASNCFGSEPIRKAERWDRKEKKEVF